MLALKHKNFGAGFWSSSRVRPDEGLNAGNRMIEGPRRLAEEFVGRIGAENVVSIVEHYFFFSFLVTVWYREEQEAKPKAARSDEFFEAPSYR